MLVGIVAGLAAVGGSLAGAADPTLDEKISSAQSEADRVSAKVDSQAAKLAELEAQAREAGARAMELSAEIELTAARSRELADELVGVRKRLGAVRARYREALGVLSERLVDIYKSPEADQIAVILSADDYDDLQNRAEYMGALNRADSRIVKRVERLHEEVEASYREVAGVKARIDEEAERLREAREEFASAQAEAERRAAEVSEVLAANQADLDQVEARLAELEAAREEQERQAAAEQESSGSEFLGGPYSIPTYIVMCESGGNYRAYNPSSGAGGAYQIIPSTWAAYGGQGLPHQASKAEQDRIAALIWADVGPSAWSCA
jgi:septal ring factor EnvC (AmiA/AmiB activator)